MRNVLSYGEYIVKMNETITDEVYHFTVMSSLFNMLYFNRFDLSHTEEDFSEIEKEYDVNKYKYYLSLSRTGDIKNSYAIFLRWKYKTDYDDNFTIRINLDGRKLSNRYKGVPINFQYIKSEIDKRSYRFEYEDRLLSNKAVIKNIHKYIKKIDIFIKKDYNEKEVLKCIQNLSGNGYNWEKKYGIKINYIYL